MKKHVLHKINITHNYIFNVHVRCFFQSQSGFFGFYASIAGVVGGIVIGRYKPNV